MTPAEFLDERFAFRGERTEKGLLRTVLLRPGMRVCQQVNPTCSPHNGGRITSNGQNHRSHGRNLSCH
jgi:hypothetical protein